VALAMLPRNALRPPRLRNALTATRRVTSRLIALILLKHVNLDIS
jgi:hypothetical protein